MRTIKFRGIRLDNGKWEYGDLMHDDRGGCYVFPIDAENLYREYQVNPDTVGQFTGFHDTNGVEVYEGDILRMEDTHNGFLPKVGYVVFIDGGFKYVNPTHTSDGKLLYFWVWLDSFDVIGNMHDNPELLTKKENDEKETI